MQDQPNAYKRCGRCGESKPRADFNAHRGKPDGLRAICRVCQVEYNREWAERNPETRRASQRRRYGRERERLGSKRPTTVMAPVQRNAHNTVLRAIQRGDITRPDNCPRCRRADSPIQGHHADYAKPLDVEWLCARCHGREHRDLSVSTGD